jgi:hypothetical protein
MKKTVTMIAAFCLVLALMGCASGGGGRNAGGGAPPPRKVSSGIPDFIEEALYNIPEDALVGIGNAKMGTDALSRTTATTRARAEISRQMSTMIQDMIRDYTASSEMDPSATISFTENITTALSKAELKGAIVKKMGVDDKGMWWVVVEFGRSNTVSEINQAQAAAKLAVPAMASFSAEARMEEAFSRIAQQEVGFASN